MKSTYLSITFSFLIIFSGVSQSFLSEVETKKFKTTKKLKIEGKIGYLNARENRNNPNSRIIKIKFVYLKSLSENPLAPVVFLEGGGSTATWQAESPKDLTDWLPILELSDLILIDQRGTDDESLTYIWQGDFPDNFLRTEQEANEHYQNISTHALSYFEEKGIDVAGYTIEEHARDVSELTRLLNTEQYSILGFSFGTHIGMATMELFPEQVDKAILVGADGVDQALNYPKYLDDHLLKIQQLIHKDPEVKDEFPDFEGLVQSAMQKLKNEPAMVSIKNPLTGNERTISIGDWGLGLILRLDIDDANDIPVIPRMLNDIVKEDYSILQWFAQRRIVFGLAVPASGINQQLASGASEKRWNTILKQAEESQFGNAVNFPFSAAKDVWPTDPLSFDTSKPITTDVPTLFVSGTLDCRTPVEQVNKTMESFTSATHLFVENAGHEQVLWDAEIFDVAFPKFLRGEDVSDIKAYNKDIKFIPLAGESGAHPSMK